MNLPDGRFLVHPTRFDALLEQGYTAEDLAARQLVRVSDDFLVIALGLPVPSFPGFPLDPPLRSRFQGRRVDPPCKEPVGGEDVGAGSIFFCETLSPGQIITHTHFTHTMLCPHRRHISLTTHSDLFPLLCSPGLLIYASPTRYPAAATLRSAPTVYPHTLPPSLGSPSQYSHGFGPPVPRRGTRRGVAGAHRGRRAGGIDHSASRLRPNERPPVLPRECGGAHCGDDGGTPRPGPCPCHRPLLSLLGARASCCRPANL